MSSTTFIWKGRSPNGEILAGEYQCNSKDELISYLRKRKIIITSVRQRAKELNVNIPFLAAKVGVKDLGVFTRQFATMINAGLPMVQCLDILGAQTEKDVFRAATCYTAVDKVQRLRPLGMCPSAGQQLE